MSIIAALFLLLSVVLCSIDFPLKACFLCFCLALIFAFGALFSKLDEILKELKKKQ